MPCGLPQSPLPGVPERLKTPEMFENIQLQLTNFFWELLGYGGCLLCNLKYETVLLT
jgi:hypothetical protein